jgi:hypothetical protein
MRRQTRDRIRGGGGKTRKTKRHGKGVGQREVHCKDALAWLPQQRGLDCIVTSIPEMEEVGLKADAYVPFFREAARKCLEAVKDTGYVVFLQTDRKYKGWMDKSYWCSDEAAKLGFTMLWHKIALRQEVGTSGLFRPTYSHMLCYSKKGKVGPLFPDVVYRGDVTYENAFGIDAVKAVLQYVKKQGAKVIVDPFAGSGTTLALANGMGLAAVGVDIDPKQCAKARTLMIE